MGIQELTDRKLLGQFFTPAFEANSIVSWAVRTGHEQILEPSVGEGGLLLPALAHARTLHLAPKIHAIACDVDKSVIDGLKTTIGPEVDLIHSDFFNLDPEKTDRVDVVLANPPFTRNHQLSVEDRARLKKRYPVKGAAGLWVYFALHARKFLRPGGRMAFLVPAASSFSRYGEDLLLQLKDEFRELSLQELPNKPSWIGSADERGVLVLADGYQAGPAPAITRGVWRYDGVARGGLSRAYAKTPAFEALKKASQPLGEIAVLSIGLVTGRNAVFLLNQQDITGYGINQNDLTPVITRTKHVRGIVVEKDDLCSLGRDGEKTWMLTPRELGERGSGVRSRLALINAKARRETLWLNKRSPWWMVGKSGRCDAVFTYMNDKGPRLALVEDGVFCTNTLHQVTFKQATQECDRLLAVVSILSTFGQLCAEGIGRGYGGGLLKFELQEARLMPILTHADGVAPDAILEIDKKLRSGQMDEARRLADAAVLPEILGAEWQAAARELEEMLENVRGARRRGQARQFEYGHV
ncbi:N-6 DNA methylase [Rhizobium laguerreae]|uniref:N-6 DNA methylase n=1 Tax=Rhizobium laguerreae TaxID=1076926 RepID=UPI001C9202B7|nr:N-6 DNA methylase [Rhizobium laguerreae]MBY3347704.1 N-6 DNA methylase [Rhizobium laguerreae]MBY3354648.1 N-6 DNA methylase [Rhizobium laguerreae]MBY3375712.1 N-6 DNA methylase [Rhizobium laguerreae]MBY3430942.1 N-6 DNA methylase [Rhizobium laguerreae]MBY3439589.1 N-6 DNA methylase [Rhizobium laguerreae]